MIFFTNTEQEMLMAMTIAMTTMVAVDMPIIDV